MGHERIHQNLSLEATRGKRSNDQLGEKYSITFQTPRQKPISVWHEYSHFNIHLHTQTKPKLLFWTLFLQPSLLFGHFKSDFLKSSPLQSK